jgi:hypothetical protein
VLTAKAIAARASRAAAPNPPTIATMKRLLRVLHLTNALQLAVTVTNVTLATMAQATWILLSSRLPREPSRLRLSIWRRLKRIGAVLLHDSVWILPADAKTREAFEWLAEEIEEQGGHGAHVGGAESVG